MTCTTNPFFPKFSLIFFPKMTAILGNLTVGSHPKLYKCQEFAEALTNLNGNLPGLKFRNSHGIEFVKVEGFRHFSVLVKERLFNFLLTILGTATLVFLFVAISIVSLAYHNYLILFWLTFCQVCTDRRQQIEPQTQNSELTCPITLVSRYLPHCTCGNPPPSYTEF